MRPFLILALAVLTACARASEVQVAAAADLVFCLNDIDAAFEQANPQATIKVSTGSSGNFFAQIQHGAPYDVFLSADIGYPQKLVSAGDARGPVLTYAVGRLALWTMDQHLDLSGGLAALGKRPVTRIAIANPAHAPYGRAARAALQHAGVWPAIQAKLVTGENISQTAQFVQSGNAEAGIVAYALLMGPTLRGIGHYALVPQDAYPALDQGAVLTRQGAANTMAVRYLAFLTTPAATAIFKRYGFAIPSSPAH